MKSLLTILLFLITSCSSFISYVEKRDNPVTNVIQKKKRNSCRPNKTVLLTKTDKNIDNLFGIIENLAKKYHFNKSERLVSFALVQMILRPHTSSPQTNAQIAILENNNVVTLQAFGQKDQFPFLSVLNKLLQKSKSSKSIIKIAKILDDNLPIELFMEKSLAKFLTNSKLDDSYTPLKANDNKFIEGDLYTRENLSKLVSRKSKNISHYKKLIYKKSKFLCNKKLSSKTSNKENEIILQNNWFYHYQGTSYFIYTSYDSSTPSLCFGKNTLISSHNSRASEQILNNIIKRLENEGISKALMHKRYIKLDFPSREIREIGLNKKHSQYIPTYYIYSIGNVWAFSNDRILHDNRSENSLICN